MRRVLGPTARRCRPNSPHYVSNKRNLSKPLLLSDRQTRHDQVGVVYSLYFVQLLLKTLHYPVQLFVQLENLQLLLLFHYEVHLVEFTIGQQLQFIHILKSKKRDFSQIFASLYTFLSFLLAKS